MPEVINTVPGQDSIKGGIFYGSNLTPHGSFSNIPQKTEVTVDLSVPKATLRLTLEKLKESFNSATKVVTKEDDVLTEQSIKTFLNTYTQLLLDNEELSNLVYFGSSYNELTYNIDYLINNFPFRAYIARTADNPNFRLETLDDNRTKITIRTDDVVFDGKLNFDNSGKTIWVGKNDIGYDFIDKSNNRYPILSFNNVADRTLIEVTPLTLDFYKLVFNKLDEVKEGDILTFYDANDNIGTGIVQEYIPVSINNSYLYSFGFLDKEYKSNMLSIKELPSLIDLTDYYIEINGGRYKIISNTFNSVTIDTEIEFKKGDLFIIERKTIINTGESTTTLHVRFTPILFENSYITTGTNNTITDNKKQWSEDQWVDKYLTIIEGSNYGKTKKIISNTSNKIIIDGVFEEPFTLQTKYLINSYPKELELITFPMSIIEFIVQGNLSLNGLLTFNISDTETERGFLISPKLTKVYNFSTQLTGIQKALLNPLNPTPWPRERFTENILTSGTTFINWIENPYNMTKVWSDDIDYYKDDTVKYNLVGAITLDETKTNILIRKFIPHELINELNETESKLFTRFILLAGKMFDTIKVYIDFLKYAHSLNYTKINQLSPQFYKQYAEHYGFSLFDEDQIELAKTVIYGDQLTTTSLTPTFSDSQNVTTVKDIINEKQKLLLINLFHLYRTKGTIDCLVYLTSLIGAPEGLVLIEEYAYNQTTREKIVKNDKINVPKIKMVIDETYLINKTNVKDPINFPYVYKYELDNDNIGNLREISLGVSPLQAILTDILNYGETIYTYGNFKERSYGSLQNNVDYFALPLSFPDKYCGINIEYNIPKGGLKKGIITNQGDCSYNLCGLIKLDKTEYKTGIIDWENTDGSVIFTTGLLSNTNFEKIRLVSNAASLDQEFVLATTPVINNEGLLEFSIDLNIDPSRYNLLNDDIDKYIITSDGYNALKSSVIPLSHNYSYKIPPVFIDEFSNFNNNENTLKKDNILKFPLTSNPFSFNNIIRFGTVGNEVLKIKLNYNGSYNLGEFNLSDDDYDNGVLKDTTIENIINVFNSNHTPYNFSIIEENGELYFISDYDIDINVTNETFISIETIDSTESIYFPTTIANVIQDEEYIFVRVEDKDLIIRFNIKSENDNQIISRLGILENVFDDDGINHRLKLLFTFKGTEVYLDNELIGIAFWKKPENNSSGWVARNYPKILIKTLTEEKLPIEMFAIQSLPIEGKDKFYWWDLFTGFPVNMDLSLRKISILENLFISQPDTIELISNPNSYINEKWIFDFSNQIRNNSGTYIKDSISIQCDYQLGSPVVNNQELNTVTAIEGNILSNVNKINLTSKILRSGKVSFDEKIMNFFENNNGEKINSIDDLFKFNAYNNLLHKNYEYNNLNEIINTYYKFAEATLTYKNLLPFIETIEDKFKRMTEQFLPIVINLSSFGRTIQNYYVKAHYSNIEYNDKATRISNVNDPEIENQQGNQNLTIIYTDTSKPTIVQKLYIYEQNENQDNIFIYEQNENQDDFIIKKQSEN